MELKDGFNGGKDIYEGFFKKGSIDSNGTIMDDMFRVVGYLGKDFMGNPEVKDTCFRTIGKLSSEVLKAILKK